MRRTVLALGMVIVIGLSASGCGQICSGTVVAVQKLGDDTKLTIRPKSRVQQNNCYVTDIAAHLVNCNVGSQYPDCK